MIRCPVRAKTAADGSAAGLRRLCPSEAGKARLFREGRLTPSTEREESYDLHGLAIDGHPMPDIRGIGVETTIVAAAAPIGITEPDVLTIGYGPLRQFRTVWDYRTRVIHLLAR